MLFGTLQLLHTFFILIAEITAQFSNLIPQVLLVEESFHISCFPFSSEFMVERFSSDYLKKQPLSRTTVPYSC